MFDNPKMNLQEIELALKDVEAPQAPEEELDWLQEAKDLLNDSATEVLPIHDREPAPRPVPQRTQASRRAKVKEELPEPDALFVEKPQRKGAGSLVFLALLELIAMGLIILWWIRWMV